MSKHTGSVALPLALSVLALHLAQLTNATTTAAPSNATNTTPTLHPGSAPPPNGSPSPAVVDLTQQCPFSSWGGSPRYCYECRWCPFRASSCCEMEDEVEVLQSVNVSGADNWDCFITIVHFQQCGRCDPNSTAYAYKSAPQLNYADGPAGWTIRPCQQACQYIYNQCKDAVTLTGDPIVPSGWGQDQFCANMPEFSTPELPCYNSAPRAALIIATIAPVLLLAAFAWL